ASSLAIQSTAGQVRSESRGEQIVTIPTERGWLRGILNSSSNSPLGIIFLHGWSGNRAGPHQMFVKLARRLYGAGYTTLRFDFYGRGESAGEIANGTLLTMIQDAQVAVDWLVERTNVQRCILLGICSGGEVAVGAALHPDVVGIVLWSTPIFARLRERGRALRKKWGYVKEYARKLFRITTWRKLFAGQLQFGIILRVLFGRTDEQPMRKEESDANRVERKHEADRKSITQPADAAPVEALERDREQLEAILAQFMKQFAKPVLMVYGTNDPDTNPATAWYRDIFESTGAPHHVHLVHGANHSYYSVAWEQEVFDVTRTWLEQLASESAHN
ncbi:MAG TPA: alpha/beta fold hydrolase, partial [Armatimonadetes bacterium]|nr:alpha/beta fold hydrolase [Armatimonadota bacterium]